MGDYGFVDIAFLLIGSIVSSGCLAMLVLGLMAMRSKHRAQQTAVPVDAVILSHRLRESCEFDGGAPTYEPLIEYEFEFNGQTWNSSNVWAGPNDSYTVRRPELDEIFAQFPVGTTVQAFCDSLEPKHAFLLRDPPAAGLFVSHALLAGSVIVIAFLFLFAGARGLVGELIAAHVLAFVAAGIWFFCVAEKDKSQ